MTYPYAPYAITSDTGDIVPQSCWVLFEHFTGGAIASSTDDAAVFDLVGTSAALTLSDSLLGGVGVLASNSTNPAFLVQNGESVKLAANRTIIYESRFALADYDGMSYFNGLAITNANPFSGSLTDYVGFFTTTGVLQAGCGKNNNNVPGSGTSGETDSSTGVTLADNTFVTGKIIIDGLTQVRFFVNNALTNTITTNLPDDEQLCVTIGTLGSGETVYTDYAACWMSNYR